MANPLERLLKGSTAALGCVRPQQRCAIAPRLILIASGLLLALGGCDRAAPKQSAAPTTGPARTGTGIVRGIVTLSGSAPEMATIPNQPCHAGAPSLREETVVADAAGDLQNVIVYLENPPPGPPPEILPAVSLDQINCQFVPHVAALRTGQTLHVGSGDPTLHNVHGLCTVNDAFNFALVAAGQSKDLRFSQPERFPVRCDVHPWMKAWVQVFDHPYFAVTAKDGTFEIKNVPAGSYTLVLWQERYGEMRVPVKVSDNQTLELTQSIQSGQ